MIRFLYLAVLLLTSVFSFAQPGVSPVKVINGTKYYVHKVEPGNTLFGLQRTYNVPMEEIVKANSGELEGGLKVGQEVLIPFEEAEDKETITSEYKVKSGETLYGISRKFNTTVDELIKLNPGVENGLQKGQKILVPGSFTEVEEEIEEDEQVIIPNPFVVENNEEERIEVSFSDSTVQHKVLAHETMYSISKRYMVSVEEIMKLNDLRSTNISTGQILKIPVKKERIDRVEIREVPPVYEPDGKGELVFDRKDKYRVVVMAPLFLDYGKGYSEYVSNMAVQFYMGTQMAIDSLRTLGLNAEIIYLDTKNDSLHVVELLNSNKFKDVDLVIGPFYPTPQRLVANYCKQNKVRNLVPVALPENMEESNRLVYAAVPSDIELIRYTAKHLKENEAKANIILVQVSKEKDKQLFDAFKVEYGSGLKESSVDNVKNYIIRGSKNIFVVPTNDKNTAMKFMNTLNKSAFRAKSDELVVYGTKDWMNFADVNGVYREKFNFHFVSNTFLDYYSDYNIEVNRKFRKKYSTDLSRMSAQGYDMMLFGAKHFLLEDDKMTLLMNKLDFESSDNSGHFKNKAYFVLEQEEYELVDAMKAANGEK